MKGAIYGRLQYANHAKTETRRMLQGSTLWNASGNCLRAMATLE